MSVPQRNHVCGEREVYFKGLAHRALGLASLQHAGQAAGLQTQEEQVSQVESEGIWRRIPSSESFFS